MLNNLVRLMSCYYQCHGQVEFPENYKIPYSLYVCIIIVNK